MTGDDRGAVTLWAVIVVLVLWAAAGVAVLDVAAVQFRHRVAAVADAAALAGASSGGLDPLAACAAARAVAGAAGGTLDGCVVAGPVVTVAVEMRPPGPLSWAAGVRGRARAGPANTGETEGVLPNRSTS